MPAPSPLGPDELLDHRRTIGHRLRDLRVAQRLSQEHLGERTGLDRRTIGRIELAAVSPTLDQLHSIAHALGVPLWRILWGP